MGMCNRTKELTDALLFYNGSPGSRDTAAEKTDFLKRCLLVDRNNGDICYDSVLRESRSSHLCPVGQCLNIALVVRFLRSDE